MTNSASWGRGVAEFVIRVLVTNSASGGPG